MKRCVDLVGASLLLVALSPLLIALIALNRLLVGAPVFFRQERPGHHGTPFRLVKFRTMTTPSGTDGALLSDSERLTRYGRFLRSTSLDELPALINVIAGDLSLVGPRPLLMEYLPLYTPEQARRHEVKPGITGWVQVNGRNTRSWEEKFAMDVWYVDNHSLALDIRILLKTVWQVIARKDVSAEGHATMPRFSGSREGREDR